MPLSSDGVDHQVFAGSPDPRQHPFGPGQQPLSSQLCGHRWRRTSLWCPVSCRLSAAGIRFSGRPAPAGEFRLPHGRPTQRTTISLGLHRGCHVPHETDTTGLGALCAPGTVVRSRPARSPRAALTASQRPAPILPLQHPIGGSANDEASTKVHAIHPSGLPQPVTTGWNGSPWAFPRAPHLAVTHDARQGGDGPCALDRALHHRHQPILLR